MHEVSLVRSIAATLEEAFSAEELMRLTNIKLRVGLLSNVEPVLLQNAFGAVQEGEGKFAGVTLAVELLPILVECEICGHRSQIDNYKFACAHCSRPTSNVVQGNELLIHQVEFSDPLPT
ncbi:hydrogenase maturation nickel metallochaperone HypA [Neolewinella lacunae]|uniref:Hydrogenase maturation factor HypA n=1 Tax=Neolewinella lacunae TaxID=1517758 RepID=A0A923PLV4_9BACT|nr:hydrogenase maturation nickel metallochaperone HypA [Neolewinella lacunae]MBC6995106.1 hydrogenase maturation nickel metallochaperone HypA [Neolewinella lacunae]MDN3634056.1 hydrogenase maturation nickel metallochaperone HypA [Neolewinella lacunae]